MQVAQQAGRWSLCFLLWMPLDDFRCPVAGLGQLPTIGLADSTHFAPDILWLVFESGYFGGGPQSAKITAGARQRCACGFVSARLTRDKIRNANSLLRSLELGRRAKSVGANPKLGGRDIPTVQGR